MRIQSGLRGYFSRNHVNKTLVTYCKLPLHMFQFIINVRLYYRQFKQLWMLKERKWDILWFIYVVKGVYEPPYSDHIVESFMIIYSHAREKFSQLQKLFILTKNISMKRGLEFWISFKEEEEASCVYLFNFHFLAAQ